MVILMYKLTWIVSSIIIDVKKITLNRRCQIMHKILIVEDDFIMAKLMKKKIEMWGHQVHIAQQYENILKDFTSFDPHLVIIDIMLPFYNGYYWCSEIRKISQVPIVFLSSASDNMNIIMAMQMGGDDFIAKPVDMNVMMAKIQAVLRRTYGMTGKIPVLEHRRAVLNLHDSCLLYNGKQVELTKNEFRILQTLLEHKGQIVSREALMTKLWQMDCYVEENTLTVNVTRLRKKLASVGLIDFIRTRVGSGYIVE